MDIASVSKGMSRKATCSIYFTHCIKKALQCSGSKVPTVSVKIICVPSLVEIAPGVPEL
jgi:hypothetical protein